MAETLIRTVDADAPSSQAHSAATIEKEKAFLSLQMATVLIDSNPSRAADLIVISFFSLIVSFLATIIPSMRAARLNPVEALRHE